MKRTKRRGNVLIVLGIIMVAAAISLYAYNVWDNIRAENASGNVTEQLDEVIYSRMQEKKRNEDPQLMGEAMPDEAEFEEEEDPYRDMPAVVIDGYGYIGTLTIPALEIELPIMEEWDYDRMKTAPCRYSGTVYLDNMVICGHNYPTHFGKLDKLQTDDLIIFTDVDGNTYKYKTAETEVLAPSQVEEMKTGDWDLTLFTCNYSGRARVAVRCSRVED